MWSHYANSHSGFCVGFNTEKIFNQIGGTLGPVIYTEEFPKFGLFENHKHQAIKSTFYKSKKWEYEREYRILKGHLPKLTNRNIKLSEKTIEEVIFGVNMDLNLKFMLIGLIEKKYPLARIFEVKLHSSKFDLVLNQIR